MLSNTRSLLNELREHVERLYMYGEVVAGSEAEKRLANEIRLQLEDYAEDVRLLPVKVLCWEDLGALVESEGKSFSAATLPPTIGGEAEGKLVKVECPFPRCFEHVSEGDIVEIRRPGRSVVMEILEIPEGRVSKKEAPRYYRIIRETRTG